MEHTYLWSHKKLGLHFHFCHKSWLFNFHSSGTRFTTLILVLLFVAHFEWLYQSAVFWRVSTCFDAWKVKKYVLKTNRAKERDNNKILKICPQTNMFCTCVFSGTWAQCTRTGCGRFVSLSAVVSSFVSCMSPDTVYLSCHLSWPTGCIALKLKKKLKSWN